MVGEVTRIVTIANDVFQLANVVIYLAVKKLGLDYFERDDRLITLTDPSNEFHKDELEEIGNILYGMRHFLTKLPE